jgi:hypothetical protein
MARPPNPANKMLAADLILLRRLQRRAYEDTSRPDRVRKLLLEAYHVIVRQLDRELRG